MTAAGGEHLARGLADAREALAEERAHTARRRVTVGSRASHERLDDVQRQTLGLRRERRRVPRRAGPRRRPHRRAHRPRRRPAAPAAPTSRPGAPGSAPANAVVPASRSSGRQVRSRSSGRAASRRARYRSASRDASSAHCRSSTATMPGAGPWTDRREDRRDRVEQAGPCGRRIGGSGLARPRPTRRRAAARVARPPRAWPARATARRPAAPAQREARAEQLHDRRVGDRPLGREGPCGEHGGPVDRPRPRRAPPRGGTCRSRPRPSRRRHGRPATTRAARRGAHGALGAGPASAAGRVARQVPAGARRDRDGRRGRHGAATAGGPNRSSRIAS